MMSRGRCDWSPGKRDVSEAPRARPLMVEAAEEVGISVDGLLSEVEALLSRLLRLRLAS